MGTERDTHTAREHAQGAPTTATSDTEAIQGPGTSFTYVPHPYIARRKREGPVKIADQMPKQNPLVRFNSRIALLITIGVGSMWCA